jgi:phospholipid/cholesterol/gamma-HCH transport system substrate-binding protein
MKRSGEIRWGELRVGLLIFVAMAIFLWASIQGGSSLFKKQYTLHSHFPNVQGVVAGAPIWFQGVEVGTVKNLDFVPLGDSSRVRVTFKIDQRVWPLIRRDSRVRIQALNLFGEKFIEVTPGSSRALQVADNDTLASDKPTDISELMARGDKIVDQLSATMTDLQFVLAKVRRGEGSLGKFTSSDEFYVGLNRTIRSAEVLTTHLDASQVQMRRSLVSLTTTLDSLSKRIDRGEGTLGRMAKDPALYDHMASASARIDSTLARVERGEGNLGQLSKDEKLYKNLEGSLARLSDLIADIQRNPKKYFSFSVF